MKSTVVPRRINLSTNITLLLLTILAFVSCRPKELPTVWAKDGATVTAKFSHQTTRAELSKIVVELKDNYGVTLSTDGTTYLENNRLQDLNIMVKTASGVAGKSSARLSNLQYAYYGFRLEQKGDQWTLVKIGNM